MPEPDAVREQVVTELDTALARLRADVRSYWSPGWRRQHTDRDLDRSPVTELWRAAGAYLELRDELLGTADSPAAPARTDTGHQVPLSLRAAARPASAVARRNPVSSSSSWSS